MALRNEDGSLALDTTVDAVRIAVESVDTKTPGSELNRIMNKQFTDAEEARYDIPADLTSSSIYIGVATDGTATSAASWNIVRVYFDGNKKPSRLRIQQSISWDNRATGW